MQIIPMLRESLQPRGNLPLVRLSIAGMGMFDKEFVTSCIDELEKKTQQASAGLYEFTPMDTLALHLLVDSTKS